MFIIIALSIIDLYNILCVFYICNCSLEVYGNGRKKDFIGGNKKAAKILQISGRTDRVWCTENII